jgi:AcrR family transcriptional regulator
MGKVERKEKSRMDMRALILDAARKLFYEEGFEKTTIRRIAKEVDYTPGSIYSYYKDKNAILYDLHIESFAKLLEIMKDAAPADLPPHERLLRCGEAYRKFAFEQPELYDLMFIQKCLMSMIHEHAETDPGIAAFAFIREIIADCIACGALPPGDVDAATFAIWGMVHGLMALAIRDRCIMIPSDHLPDLIQSAAAYLMKAALRRPD